MAAQEIITVEQGTAGIIAEAEINQQVATARRFPRSEGAFYQKAQALVLASEESAAECIYALPRGGKTIEGPSVRMAEILAHSWGNVRVGARIIDETERFITAQGVFHDLETNVARSVTIQRRITDSHGRRYNDDMIGVTANAAASIAMREATLKGIPRAIWGDIYAKARALVTGTIEDMGRRRDAAVKAFQLAGLPQDIMLKIVNRRSLKDIEPNDLIALRGVLVAIRDGDTSAGSIVRQYGEEGGQAAPQGERADIAGKLRQGNREVGTVTDSYVEATQKAQEGDKGEGGAEGKAEVAPAASVEATGQGEAENPEAKWTDEEATLIADLTAALGSSANLDEVAAAVRGFGGRMKGQRKALVDLCNNMREKRQAELKGAKSSASLKL